MTHSCLVVSANSAARYPYNVSERQNAGRQPRRLPACNHGRRFNPLRFSSSASQNAVVVVQVGWFVQRAAVTRNPWRLSGPHGSTMFS